MMCCKQPSHNSTSTVRSFIWLLEKTISPNSLIYAREENQESFRSSPQNYQEPDKKRVFYLCWEWKFGRLCCTRRMNSRQGRWPRVGHFLGRDWEVAYSTFTNTHRWSLVLKRCRLLYESPCRPSRKPKRHAPWSEKCTLEWGSQSTASACCSSISIPAVPK